LRVVDRFGERFAEHACGQMGQLCRGPLVSSAGGSVAMPTAITEGALAPTCINPFAT
jgi:hypothetical protein